MRCLSAVDEKYLLEMSFNIFVLLLFQMHHIKLQIQPKAERTIDIKILVP